MGAAVTTISEHEIVTKDILCSHLPKSHGVLDSEVSGAERIHLLLKQIVAADQRDADGNTLLYYAAEVACWILSKFFCSKLSMPTSQI